MDHADKSGRVPWGRILLLGCVAAGGLYWALFRTDVVEDNQAAYLLDLTEFLNKANAQR